MRQMAPTQLGVSQCGNFVWNLSRAGRESAGQRGAEAACDRPRQTAPRPPPRVVSRLARTEKTSGASSNMSSRKCRRAPPSAARAAVAASLSPRALLCCPASLPPASALCALYDDATSANCCLASLTSFACACVSCPSDERKSTRWYGRPEGSPAALSRRAPDTRAHDAHAVVRWLKAGLKARFAMPYCRNALGCCWAHMEHVARIACHFCQLFL